MSEWREVKLGDVCEFHYGKSLPATKRKKGNIPVYGSAGIIGYHNEALINSKGIIIGRKGTIGKVYKSYKPFFPIDTVFYVLPDDKKYNFEYMFYLLVSLNLDKLNEDSAVPGLNRNNAYNQQIKLPPLPIQKKIADILSVIDEKIETLQNINSTLEEMAKAIFKSWFVDFDIVKAKASGKSDSEIAKEFGISKDIVKLFPSEFETSEIGKIPKGWEVKSIKEIGKVITGKTPPTKNKENFGNKYPFIKIPDMKNVYTFITETYLSEIGKNLMNNKKLPPNSICVSCIATVGLVTLTSENISFTNQQINSIICNEGISYYFIYLYMLALKNHIENLGRGGTATLNVNKTSFEQIKIKLPINILLDKFHSLIEPNFQVILNNLYHIQTLQELRDTLLPKLINGKIEVDELDIKGLE